MSGSLHHIDRPGAEGRLAASRPFLFRERHPGCRECWGCVRHCPARAMRVVDRRAEIITEKCVKCGLCVSACGNAGHEVRDDLPQVTRLLAGDRPVVAVLATEFVAALYPMTPPEIERGLEQAGFYAVESTLLGEEMVALEYERLHARPDQLLTVRSTCPVAVAWVQRFHPSLVSALAPVPPPYVAQARLVKELYPEGTAVVYVSPCYARKDEAADPQFGGVVDAAIDFKELERLLSGLPLRSAPAPKSAAGTRRPVPIKELSLTDGFPRRTVTERDRTDPRIQVVRGLQRFDRLLAAIEAGESAPMIIDILSCEGCIDGPAVNPGLSVFAKRNIVAAERARNVVAPVSSRALLSHLPSVEMRRSFVAEPFITTIPAPDEIDRVLAEGEFMSREDAVDCGACGYDTCVDHAIAILEGNSSWEMCFPVERRRMAQSIEQLSESATIDGLTGLWNRRAFSERLGEETSRVGRYGGDVSLLMMDVDGFKSVNDRFGHLAGDSVLHTVSEVLRRELRVTDVPARYGGDEFAIILPGIGKTEAFVVAEKLRAGISAREYGFHNGEKTPVTVSIGVASVRAGHVDPIELMDAADRALYQAKQSGRDQVRLAPG